MIVGTGSRGAIVDAHVHMYDCFDLHRFLTGANRNLCAAAKSLGLTHTTTNVLMLAETDKESGFHRLLQLSEHRRMDRQPGFWNVERNVNDPAAVSATSPEGNIIIVAGRQVISSEGLEVLALGTETALRDGTSLAELVREINALDAIPVLPWGVGKWLGRRGQVVKSYIESSTGDTVFLGDILGRPAFWPRSSIFRAAIAHGIDVLPGTDPLPLESETLRAGSCGFYIECDLNGGPPGLVLKEALQIGAIEPFTRRESSWRFFRNQVRVRLR